MVVLGTYRTTETGARLWEAWADSPPGREGSQEKWKSGDVLNSVLLDGIVVSVVDRARLELASATERKKGRSRRLATKGFFASSLQAVD